MFDYLRILFCFLHDKSCEEEDEEGEEEGEEGEEEEEEEEDDDDEQLPLKTVTNMLSNIDIQ